MFVVRLLGWGLMSKISLQILIIRSWQHLITIPQYIMVPLSSHQPQLQLKL